MSDHLPSTRPPIPLATRPRDEQAFSTVKDALASSSADSVVIPASRAVLGALQDIFEAVNTLPCIKYVAGVSIKILQIIEVSADIRNITLTTMY